MMSNYYPQEAAKRKNGQKSKKPPTDIQPLVTDAPNAPPATNTPDAPDAPAPDCASPDPEPSAAAQSVADEDIIHKCTENWTAAQPDSVKRSWDVFDETGIFVSICRHGFVLAVADMRQTGEQYVLFLPYDNL